MKRNWEYKKLGEVCDSLTGLWTGKKEPFVNVAVIRNTNFSKDCKLKLDDVAYLDVEQKQYSTRKLLPGDIIVEKSGGSDKQPVGRVVLFDIPKGEFSFSNFTGTLRIKNKRELNSRFLHRCLFAHYLRGETRKLQSKTTGLHNLDMKGYLKLPIPVPSLEEQQRIVAELDLLTGIIDKQNAQLKELDNLAQAIFYDMFGDPIENPKGWSCSILSEKCEVSSSKRVLVEDAVDSGIPFLRGTELTMLSKAGSSKDVKFTMFITQEHYERVKAITGVPKKGDILIPSINSNGFTWIVDTDSPFYFKDGRVLWVHVNEKYFASHYLKNAISRIISGTYTQLTDGATFLELKLFNIRDMIVPVPPLALQQSFAEKIQSIEKQKETIRASIADTQKLLDYTMDKYFG